MSSYLTAGTIKITKVGYSQQQIEFAQTLSTDNRQEVVSVSVIIPLSPGQTVQEIYQAASERAAWLLTAPYTHKTTPDK